MSEITVVRNGNYTAIINDIYRHKGLSGDAMGLHSFMMSLPPSWDFSIVGLSKCFPHGIDKIRTTLLELEKSGFLIRKQGNKQGKFGRMKYLLFEESRFKKNELEADSLDLLNDDSPEITIVKRTYTMIDNAIFRDPTISMSATGIFCFMMSLPPSWDYSILGLTKCLPHGKKYLTKYIKELETKGYLFREQIKENGKFKGMKYTLYEVPKTHRESENIDKSDFLPLTPFPMTVNPTTPNPTAPNPTQLNTNRIKYLNNKSLKESKRKPSNENHLIKRSKIDHLKRLVKKIQIPVEIEQILIKSLDHLLNTSESFTKSGIKTKPEDLEKILDSMTDHQIIEAILIPVTTGYIDTLESGAVIKNFQKLMMMILYNAIIHEGKTQTIGLYKTQLHKDEGGTPYGNTWNLSD